MSKIMHILAQKTQAHCRRKMHSKQATSALKEPKLSIWFSHTHTIIPYNLSYIIRLHRILV